MAKTLILGIGTTGLRIIEEAQQYHYEFTGRNKPGKNTSYIYIETDTSRLAKSTAGGNSEIEAVLFDFDQINVDIEILNKEKTIDSSWIPAVNYLEQSHLGAGGMPSFGRLSLWKTNNYQNIRSTIERKFHEIGGDKDTTILVVGTLTGGTGSGLAVDIAYLIQDILPNNVKNIHSLFLLPNRSSLIEDISLHENSFSATTAINFYSDPKNSFNIVWPDKSKFKSSAPPYQISHYLSQDFSNGDATGGNVLANITSAASSYKLVNFKQYVDTGSGDTFAGTLGAVSSQTLIRTTTAANAALYYANGNVNISQFIGSAVNDGFQTYQAGTRTFRQFQLKFIIQNNQPDEFDFTIDKFRYTIEKDTVTFTDTTAYNATTKTIDITSAGFLTRPVISYSMLSEDSNKPHIVVTTAASNQAISYQVFKSDDGGAGSTSSGMSVMLTATGV